MWQDVLSSKLLNTVFRDPQGGCHLGRCENLFKFWHCKKTSSAIVPRLKREIKEMFFWPRDC
jgi:hypothetical protein